MKSFQEFKMIGKIQWFSDGSLTQNQNKLLWKVLGFPFINLRNL